MSLFLYVGLLKSVVMQSTQGFCNVHGIIACFYSKLLLLLLEEIKGKVHPNKNCDLPHVVPVPHVIFSVEHKRKSSVFCMHLDKLQNEIKHYKIIIKV